MIFQVADGVLGVEQRKIYAFKTSDTIQEIGLSVGALDTHPDDKKVYPVIFGGISKESCNNIALLGLTIHHSLNSGLARLCNGREIESSVCSVFQIGVGALGSQIARNLTQSGFCKNYVFLDNDVLLPHNLSRYITTGNEVGSYKATAIARTLNTLVDDKNYSVGIAAKVPFGKMEENLLPVIREETEVIIDASASIPVQRTLDKSISNEKRRFTAFLTPNGKSTVLLFTPSDSEFSHTMLEASYYYALVNNPEFNDLLETDLQGFTYSGDSCRSISAELSTHYVSLLSAIVSQCIDDTSGNTSAFVKQWIIKEDLELSFTSISPIEFIDCGKIDGKRVYLSTSLQEKLNSLREEALPNETGGVLIGLQDPINQAMYVVDHLEAPIDSTASPQHFHRGVNGVDDKLKHIEKITHRNLVYLGEWHSHPNRTSVTPSVTDEQLLTWLRDQSQTLTYPYLMLILGDQGKYSLSS